MSRPGYLSRAKNREGARIEGERKADSGFSLVDDHLKCLGGVRRLLENKYDVVGTIADDKTLINAATRLRPDSHRSGHLHAQNERPDGGLKSSGAKVRTKCRNGRLATASHLTDYNGMNGALRSLRKPHPSGTSRTLNHVADSSKDGNEEKG